jgi:hypothetical protein
MKWMQLRHDDLLLSPQNRLPIAPKVLLHHYGIRNALRCIACVGKTQPCCRSRWSVGYMSANPKGSQHVLLGLGLNHCKLPSLPSRNHKETLHVMLTIRSSTRSLSIQIFQTWLYAPSAKKIQYSKQLRHEKLTFPSGGKNPCCSLLDHPSDWSSFQQLNHKGHPTNYRIFLEIIHSFIQGFLRLWTRRVKTGIFLHWNESRVIMPSIYPFSALRCGRFLDNACLLSRVSVLRAR